MLQTQNKQNALDELAGYRQWVTWEYDRQERKIPINPDTWRAADTSKPDTWGTFEEALAAAGSSERAGFVFSADDPYTGIDLDICIDDGEVASWAVEIVDALDSYTEISPSGTGLKIWVRGRKPGEKCRTGNIEIYDKERFFTFTGRTFHKGSIEDRQNELERLYNRLFPEADNEEVNTVVLGSGFAGEDAELLDKARNANGTGMLFAQLYDQGDTSMYSYDHSDADMALCGMLAFWTGRDDERVDRLFRGSKLMRRKWDERRGTSTYGDKTIAKAIKGCSNVYNPDYKADDIHRMLEGCFELVVSGFWGGRSGPTDRNVYKVGLTQEPSERWDS